MASMPAEAAAMPPRRLALTRGNVCLLFVGIAVVLVPFADLAVANANPWAALSKFAAGFLAPDFAAVSDLGRAVLLTLAFAVAGVALGGAAGFALALASRSRGVRGLATTLRSIHELFWALLLMQPFGPSALTGVLAIALPYAGIFAKVYGEMLEEADRRPADVLPKGTGAVSAFLYARLPLALAPMKVYGLYRVECGIRSSAVIGFVGLPTLGFELDSFFRQGEYGAVAAILLTYYLLIGTIRWWMRAKLLPLYFAAALAVLLSLGTVSPDWANVVRVFTVDIVPAPLRGADLFAPATWAALAAWLKIVLVDQAAPGLVATFVVTQLTLVVMGIVALGGFALLVRNVVGRIGARAGHVVLVVLRSTPEYMLAYLALQVLGPSMLPAVIALGLHNGAIIAHLLGREGERLSQTLRPDAPRGLDLYGYELVPRLFGPFLAYACYRWEIVMRESAIVGILGVATLGFFIDSAIAEIRLDRALVLIAVTVAATAAIDFVSRRIRAGLALGAFGGVAAQRFPAR
ncbi:PhnE/PtxC family ABC transporter permease [Xanthobacter tagetidis]|nr:ABC transporter permease [Xanthobacter tagetidis]